MLLATTRQKISTTWPRSSRERCAASSQLIPTATSRPGLAINNIVELRKETYRLSRGYRCFYDSPDLFEILLDTDRLTVGESQRARDRTMSSPFTCLSVVFVLLPSPRRLIYALQTILRPSNDNDYDIPEGSERSLIQMVINSARKFSSFCWDCHCAMLNRDGFLLFYYYFLSVYFEIRKYCYNSLALLMNSLCSN